MIISKYYKTRDDGVVLNRTYSDKGLMIERDGVQYDDAIDPVDSGRTYTETDVPILTAAANEEDYINALESLGVNFND